MRQINDVDEQNYNTTLDKLGHYRAFSCDVTAAILVFPNKETADILVYQTSPLGAEFYFYVKIVFCLSKAIWRLVT